MVSSTGYVWLLFSVIGKGYYFSLPQSIYIKAFHDGIVLPHPFQTSMSSQSTINATPILGPTVIGILVSAVLFGVFTTQTWVYFQTFPKDRRWLKLMVSNRRRLIDTLHLIPCESVIGLVDVVCQYHRSHGWIIGAEEISLSGLWTSLMPFFCRGHCSSCASRILDSNRLSKASRAPSTSHFAFLSLLIFSLRYALIHFPGLYSEMLTYAAGFLRL